jgi:hypothetical protein
VALNPSVLPVAFARRRQHAVRRPRLRILRKRQFTTLCDPDAIWCFREDGADRSPRPAVVLYTVSTIGQRLRPVFDELVRTEFFLTAFFSGYCRCGRGRNRLRRRSGRVTRNVLYDP